MRFSIQTHSRWTRMNITLMSFASSRTWTLLFVKNFNVYMQRRSSMSDPKQWTNQKTPEAGQALPAYYLQQKIGMATVLFDLNMAEKAFYSVLLSKPFLSAASRVFRCIDTLCVNGPLIMHTNDVIVELQWVMCWKQITFVATNTSQITGFFIPLLIPPIK